MRRAAVCFLVAAMVLVQACAPGRHTAERGVVPFSDPDLVNPMRGQYENQRPGLFPQVNRADEGYPRWPGTADTNLRVPWSALQPKDPRRLPANAPDSARYDFSALDAAIAYADARGMRFGFRVTAFDSCCVPHPVGATISSAPRWLRSIPGATRTYDHDGRHYVIPEWNDDEYLTLFSRLLAALGRRYDRDERVALFEVSGYGDFSENHVAFMRTDLGRPGPAPESSEAELGYYSQYRDQYLTEASAQRIVDANLKAFPRTQIIAAMGNPAIAKLLLRDSPRLSTLRRPVGMRSDALGAYPPLPTWAENPYSEYVKRGDPIVQTIAQRYRDAPIVTEWPPQLLTGGTELQYYERGLRDVVRFHVSMTSSGGFPDRNRDTPMSRQVYGLWERANKYAGYRYAATQVTLGPNGAELGITWANFASAPTYDRWHTEYSIIDSEGRTVATLPARVRLDRLSGGGDPPSPSGQPTAGWVVDRVPVQRLARGEYTVRVRVAWAEHKPNATRRVDRAPMNLAMRGRDADGWYEIGTIAAP